MTPGARLRGWCHEGMQNVKKPDGRRIARFLLLLLLSLLLSAATLYGVALMEMAITG